MQFEGEFFDECVKSAAHHTQRAAVGVETLQYEFVMNHFLCIYHKL